MTLTHDAEHLAVELSLPVLTTYICRGWDSKSQSSACQPNALTECATANFEVTCNVSNLKPLVCIKNLCRGSVVDEHFVVNLKMEDGPPMKTKTNVECSFDECLKCDLKIDGILMMYLTLLTCKR